MLCEYKGKSTLSNSVKMNGLSKGVEKSLFSAGTRLLLSVTSVSYGLILFSC